MNAIEHQFYYDVLRSYENYLNDNNLSFFRTSLDETLIQYQIDNNLE